MKYTNIYFLGIGGIGMSALARYFHAKGFAVAGYDRTRTQLKELKAVVAEADNDLEKARPSIIEKLKSFGTDVVSNIVANVLTNPAIWSGL